MVFDFGTDSLLTSDVSSIVVIPLFTDVTMNVIGFGAVGRVFSSVTESVVKGTTGVFVVTGCVCSVSLLGATVSDFVEDFENDVFANVVLSDFVVIVCLSEVTGVSEVASSVGSWVTLDVLERSSVISKVMGVEVDSCDFVEAEVGVEILVVNSLVVFSVDGFGLVVGLADTIVVGLSVTIVEGFVDSFSVESVATSVLDVIIVEGLAVLTVEVLVEILIVVFDSKVR